MRIRVHAVLVVLAVILFACSSTATAPEEAAQATTPEPATTEATTSGPAATGTATRTVSHVLGEVEVPADPQRVVTLDVFAFEAASVLDVPVVGAVANPSMTEGILATRLEGVALVGTAVGEPDLERIAALDPDLILGGFANESELDDLLAAIAPTYLGIDFDTSGQWKEIFLALADAVGRESMAEELLAAYEQRAATVVEDAEVSTFSTIRAYPDSVFVYGPDSFAGTVVADTGLEVVVPEDGADEFGAELSYENLTQIDADVVLFWTANEDEPDAVLEGLQTSPLYGELSAVQADRVAFGGQHWIGSGLIAADAVLDDLAEAL